jgi:hypothetical protein
MAIEQLRQQLAADAEGINALDTLLPLLTLGLPGALIPVSFHTPVQHRQSRRLALTLMRSRAGLWVPASGPEAIRRTGAMRGLGCRWGGSA